MVRSKKTLEERQAKNLQRNLYREKVYNNKLKKKADKLNKIMSGKNVKNVVHEDERWTVYFKNGQVLILLFCLLISALVIK